MKPKHSFFILFIIFTAVAFRTSFDSDFGWHLRTGENIVQTGTIPKVDTYTFTFLQTPYIYHSWIAEVVIYFFFSLAGFWGISLLYSGLIGASLTLLTDNFPFTKFELALFAAIELSLVELIGYRTQTFSAFFFALTYWLTQPDSLHQSKAPLKRLVLLIPLFFIWANTHPGFLLGFPLVIFHLAIWLVQNKKRLDYVKPVTAIVSLCMAVTLINPYGYHLHLFLKQMLTNQTASLYIFDWTPFLDLVSVGDKFKFMVVLLFSLTFLLTQKQWTKRFLLLVFFILMLRSTRYTLPFTLMLLATLPYTIRQLTLWLKSQEKIYRRLLQIVLSLMVVSRFFTYIPLLAATYCANNSLACLEEKTPLDFRYPYRAVEYIKANNLPGQILNDFNWGGYLIWQMPERKVFVDGRMDNFFMENGTSFLTEYIQIVTASSNWEEKLKYYQIQTVLLRPRLPLVKKLRVSPSWKLVFENESSVIFVNIPPDKKI